MAINYAAQFAPKVAETFAKESLTDSACGREYQFTGTKTVKVMTVDTVPLGNYTRSGVNRYGTPVELGDVTQELTIDEDKAFAMTIDKGNDMDQMNLKGAAEAMKREMAQVVVPYIDKYRLDKWAHGAGIIKSCAANSVSTNLLELIFDLGAAMDNAGVPGSDRTLFLPNSLYKELALADKLVGVDKLGEQALAKGIVGAIDGMTVKRVPDSYMPAGVYALAKWKNASADPVKLQEGKIHKDPPGISGNLLEGRIYQDSFVLAAKCNGIAAIVDSTKLSETPTINVNGTTVNILCSSDGASSKYTTDGSDPRYSSTAKMYVGGFSAARGTVVRASSSLASFAFFSPVAERTV